MSTGFSLRAANGREYPVAGRLRLGRAPDSEVLLPDGLVSRLHAQVWVENDRLLIRDEHSSNGTFVNGPALRPGDDYRLRPGDTVRVGATTFTVIAGPAAGTAPLPANTRIDPAAAAAAAAQPPMPAASPVAQPPPPPATTRIEPTAAAAAAPAPAASNRSRNLVLGGCLVLVLLALCGGLGLFGGAAGWPAIGTALARLGGQPAPGPGTPTPIAPATATSLPAAPSPNPSFTVTPGPAAQASAIPVTVIGTEITPASISPAQFAATGQDMAAALAALNQAQLHFIAEAGNTKAPAAPAALDADLRTIAANAFKVGEDGEQLCLASSGQGGGSAAGGQSASLYANLWRSAFAQTLDAQNLRASLAAGKLDRAAAAALVADDGARAWNPSVADPTTHGNPFFPFLAANDAVPTALPLPPAASAAIKTSLGANAALLTWSASAADTITRTVRVPAGSLLGDPLDPALITSLMTPAGQADAAGAYRTAEFGLRLLGAMQQPAAGARSPVKGLAALSGQAVGDLLVSFSSKTALYASAAVEALGGSGAPAFPGGKAAALTQGANGGIVAMSIAMDPAFNVLGISPDSHGASYSLMNLEITNPQVLKVDNIHVAPPGEADAIVTYSFDISWSGIFTGGFTLDCGGGAMSMTTASGSQTIQFTVPLLLYPGPLWISCFARLTTDPLASSPVGYASLRVDVGGPASGARIEAATQVSAKLTQDAGPTQTAQAAQLFTEQTASQTAEFAAQVTHSAAQTAQAAAAGVFTLNGTFSLVQNDGSGCTFTNSPATSGLIQLNVDFNQGTASASLQGSGSGLRSGLMCNNDVGDMTWQQTYSVTLSGTIDKTSGALALAGTLNGNRVVTWSNCTHAGEKSTCPARDGGDYSFPATLSGTVDKSGGTGKGTWVVNKINLPTSGDWSAGK